MGTRLWRVSDNCSSTINEINAVVGFVHCCLQLWASETNPSKYTCVNISLFTVKRIQWTIAIICIEKYSDHNIHNIIIIVSQWLEQLITLLIVYIFLCNNRYAKQLTYPYVSMHKNGIISLLKKITLKMLMAFFLLA